MIKFLNASLFWTAVFVSGASVMILEILGTKITQPFFGVTLYVWAAMIAVTLLSLSLGYWAGGLLADRRPSEKIFYGILFLAGILIAVIPWMAPPVMKLFKDMDLRVGVLLSSFLLFSLPLFLHGMVSPLAVKLCLVRMEKAGITAGNIYAISTVGSLAGTLATAFFLIPSFPMKHVLFFQAALLWGIALLGLWSAGLKHRLLMGLLTVSISTPFWLIPPNGYAGTSSILYQTYTPYGKIQVVKDSYRLSLLVNGAAENAYVIGQDPYDFVSSIDYASFLASVAVVRPNLRKVLVVGLGAGRLPMYLSRQGIETDIIEIDPEIFRVAEKFFGFSHEQDEIFYSDGRPLMRRLGEAGKKYDAVFIDAYASYELPAHFFTLEMFREVRQILAPGGVVAINTGGSLEAEGAEVSRALFATLRKSFPFVKAYEVFARRRLNNFIFWASEESLDIDHSRLPQKPEHAVWKTMLLKHDVTREIKPGGAILTDDYNPLPYLAIPMYQKARDGHLDYFGEEVLTRI